MDDLLQDFLTETSESLSNIDNDLVSFEQTPDNPDLIRNIFRMVHTIKGTCGFIGLSRLGHVAHAAENVLGLFRDGKLAPDAASIGIVLEAIDRIKGIVAGIEGSGSEPQGDDSELIGRLDAVAGEDKGAAPHAEPVFEPVVVEAPVEAEPVVDFEPVPATALAATPDAVPHDDVAPTAAPAAQNAPTNGGAVPANQTVRVSVGLLETLMSAVSELVLTRNQLVQGLRETESGAVQVPVQRLSQIASELQEGVMKTRMQPIGNAWQKLPRLIRDLTREVGKKIDLNLIGSETEVDRQVLEIIKDPLTHMVRNSADHGLETPEERRQAGKPEAGRITIRACHQGGHILIEISDDGRGLNTSRIRRKIVEKGLATEAAAAQLSDSQVQQYIFDAGFSTAAQVTAVSGRGVGMDVVRTNVEKIGGSIDLSSEEGKGTKFTIRIPLTLAIVSALIIETGGERYAVPQLSVLELVMVSENSERRIETLNGMPLLRVRDRLVPLVYLDAVLGLQPSRQTDQGYVLLLEAGNQQFGLVVDRVLDTEEIVVKPTAPILKDLAIYAGNTILGDGSVIMILDPNGLAAGVTRTKSEVTSRVSGKPEDQVVSDKVGALLFEATGKGPLCAVPLSLVDRIEDLDLKTVENVPGRQVVQYRGALMPLVRFDGSQVPSNTGKLPTLVFAGANGPVGLVVERIVDVVETSLKAKLTSRHPASHGTATIAGRATEVVNTEYLAATACGDSNVIPLNKAA